MRIPTFLLILLLINPPLFAQTEINSSAQKWLKKAYVATLKKEYLNAEKCYLKSLEKDPQNMDAYSALGRLYQMELSYDKAADLYLNASKICRQCKMDFKFPLADFLYKANRYQEAKQILNQFSESEIKTFGKKYEMLLQNIVFAEKAIKQLKTATPINMGLRINSEFDDYFPSITANDSTLVFTRKTNGIDEDFYVAKRDSCGGWFMAKDMGSPPNSPLQEGAQMLSADGHYLFFMRCDNRSENGWADGGCDLYFSYTENGGWSEPVLFRGMVNTNFYEGTPSLSSDNRTLYFASDRPGGYGGLDIWMTVFKDGLWQIPVNMGPEINSAGNEMAPWIAADNSTLYFTSDGHPGFGGNDIYLSRKLKDNTWTKPQNLGYPFNSSAEDISFCLSADGKKGYFSSNRQGGFGGMDLYEITLDSTMQPKPYTMIYGIVTDSLSKGRIPYAQIEWSDASTGKLLNHFQSNSGDASYFGALSLHQKLALKVYRYGYLDWTDTLTFDKAYFWPPDTFNISILPNSYQPPLSDSLLITQNFSKNEVTLTDSTIAIIKEKLKPYLTKTANQKYVEFFINGFTDNTGTPEINQEISFARARLIGTLLFNLGIPEEKIHVQGWADANPVAPNDTEENRTKNRRVELVVRSPK